MRRNTPPTWAGDVLASLPPVLTRREAALALNLSVRSLDRRVRAQAIEATRTGSRVLIPRAAIVAHLSQAVAHG